MRRPTTRNAVAAATVALAVAGSACATDEPGPLSDVETDQPVVVDPNEEVGETLLPETPAEAEPGTDG